MSDALIMTQADHMRKMRACARLLLSQIRARIHASGAIDGEPAFAPLDFPRLDGSRKNPLHPTGSHLLNSLKAGWDANEFWVESKFAGAEILDKGTTGKGGSMPPIVPKVARVLAFPVFGGRGKGTKRIFAKKINIRPRPYMTVTPRNMADLQKTYQES